MLIYLPTRYGVMMLCNTERIPGDHKILVAARWHCPRGNPDCLSNLGSPVQIGRLPDMTFMEGAAGWCTCLVLDSNVAREGLGNDVRPAVGEKKHMRGIRCGWSVSVLGESGWVG